MGLGGALRRIIRPLSSLQRILPLLSLIHFASKSPLPLAYIERLNLSAFFDCQSRATMATRSLSSSGNGGSMIIGSLTDTRLPKRRAGTKPQRKRASLRPKGPYAWVPYMPGEPIPSSRPNEVSKDGSVGSASLSGKHSYCLRRKNVKLSGQRLERRNQWR